MANKKTVVQMYEELLALPNITAEQKSFLEKRIEITKKKNASGKGGELTPKQKEKMEQDKALQQEIVAVMEQGATYSPTDLLKMVNNPAIPSTQKLTPLLTALVNDSVLTKSIVKGRSVYSLSVAEVDEAEG